MAYHSVLVFNVLGTSELVEGSKLRPLPDDAPDQVVAMQDIVDALTLKNFQESFHDAQQIREESLTLFNVGMLSLEHRAIIEQLFWLACQKISKIINCLDYVPDELESLDRFISDTYYCNFSVFQSLPDHWAVKQLFPIMPIHRLNTKPQRKATLADITCDSDGKVDQFIDLRDVKNTIELHEFDEKRPYYLGVFLVGAYQEVLGDLHNLFGDTHIIHISITGQNKYHIDKVIEGDSVRDVLAYMQYQKRDIVGQLSKSIEAGIESKLISIKESARIKKFLDEGLEGYTYLE